MFRFVKRNFKQLQDFRVKATNSLGKKARFDFDVLQFLRNLKTTEQKIRLILNQQEKIKNGAKSINNRIVSFHKDHVRPIVRGKFPIFTEFGPKVFVAILKGYSYCFSSCQNNIADSSMLLPSIRWFKHVFGKLPKKILADRGFWSRHNSNTLNKLTIHCGIQKKGRQSSISPTAKKDVRQRQIIESRISLLKRKFGWSRCLARNPTHETAWMRSQAVASNVHLAFFANST